MLDSWSPPWMHNAVCTALNLNRFGKWMPGWLSSAASGPLMWMLWSATWTVWNGFQARKETQEDYAAQTANMRKGLEMKIKVTKVYVDDQNKALRFYTEVLGMAKKADFS